METRRQRRGGTISGVIVTLCSLTVMVSLLWGAHYLGQQSAATHIIATGPKIEDVRRIAKLGLLRVQVANVIEGTTRGARALVLVHGDADIAVDLDQIRMLNCDPEQRHATVQLPQPHPDRPRVNHEQTRIFELQKTGLAAINPFADPRQDLLEDCMRAAQVEVEKSVADKRFIAQAKDQTELLLFGFYHEVGWTVAVEWVDTDAG